MYLKKKNVIASGTQVLTKNNWHLYVITSTILYVIWLHIRTLTPTVV